MKAVILAAGMGRRLTPMQWDKPKTLLAIGGTTLLGNILDSLINRGVKEAVIVVGYQGELVAQEAKRHDIECAFVENVDFASTNTIYSLFLAREHLSNGFLYFNADVWFDPRVLDLLMGGSADRLAVVGCSPDVKDRKGTIARLDGEIAADSVLVVDERRCGNEEVKVIVDGASLVTRIGKDLNPQDCAGEFIGIARFNPSICSDLVGSLTRYCKVEPGHGGEVPGPHSRGPSQRDGLPTRRIPKEESRWTLGRGRHLFFEAALDDILSGHIVRTAALGKLRAVEIDTPEDYARARGHCHGSA